MPLAVVGRNLVSRPYFDTATPGPGWAGGTVGERTEVMPGGGTGYRINTSSGYMSVLLPGEPFIPGTVYEIWLWAYRSKIADSRVAIGPGPDLDVFYSGMFDAGLANVGVIPRDTTAGYQFYRFTLTATAGEYLDELGNDIDESAQTTAVVFMSNTPANGNQTGVSYIRVDRVGTIEGLFSGDGPAAAQAPTDPNLTYAWAGDRMASASTALAVPADEPPSAPTGLAAAVTVDTVSLQWDAASDDDGVTGYNVYRDGAKVNAELVAATQFVDTELTAATEYVYTVTAVDTADQEGPASDPLTVKTSPTEPGPSPTEPPWDAFGVLAAELAPRVADWLDRDNAHPLRAQTVATAIGHLPLVAEYVRGYTRGRGFDGDTVAGPLAAVIVTAAARLTANPEQVTAYESGDYTERPARLTGWTAAELAVLRRYRRTTGATGALPADDGIPWQAYETLAAELAPRVADHLGRTTDNGPRTRATTAAAAVIPAVAEYVRGYTRGHGWDGTVPAAALQTVIVAAAARAVANPKQVEHYSLSDYAERPARLTGWTLPELDVLRRYRKVGA